MTGSVEIGSLTDCRTEREQAPAPRFEMRHYPALDGIRGAAVAAVLLFHDGRLRGGFLGVDMFFVLSGFLITSLLLSEVHRTDGVKLGSFWLRRARRLVPALLIALLLAALYAWRFAPTIERGAIRSDAWWTILYSANWRSILTAVHGWDIRSFTSPLAPTWSLAIEEQFYLVWPLVVFAFVRWTRGGVVAVARRLAVVSGGLLVVSYGVTQVLYRASGPTTRVFYGTDTRSVSIIAGVLLACLAVVVGHPERRLGRRLLDVAAWCSVVGVLVLWSSIGETSSRLFRAGLLVDAIGVAAILARVTAPYPGLLTRALSWRPLRGLGSISYGLYLYHWPIFLMTLGGPFGLHGLTLSAFRYSLSIAAATVSLYLIERPIRRGRWNLRALERFAPASLVVVIGALLLTTQPVPLSKRPDPNGPPRGLPASWPRVLFAGDGTAWQLGTEALVDAKSLGIAPINGASPSCGITGSGSVRARLLSGRVIPLFVSDCPTRWPALSRKYRAPIVIVSVSGQAGADWEISGVSHQSCDPDFPAWYGSRLASGLRTFTSAGVRVVLLNAPLPGLSAHQPGYMARFACFNRVLDTVAAGNSAVHIVDVDAWLCPGGRCRRRIDGVAMRPDGLTISGPSAHVMLAWLVPEALKDAVTSG